MGHSASHGGVLLQRALWGSSFKFDGVVGGSESLGHGWVLVWPFGRLLLWLVCCEGLVGLSCGFQCLVWFAGVGRFSLVLAQGYGWGCQSA